MSHARWARLATEVERGCAARKTDCISRPLATFARKTTGLSIDASWDSSQACKSELGRHSFGLKGGRNPLPRECREAATCNLANARRQPRSNIVAKREARATPIPAGVDCVLPNGGRSCVSARVPAALLQKLLELAGDRVG